MRLAATFLLAFRLFAQSSLVPSLKDIFNLTPDQVQKVSAIFADYNSFASEKNARMSELNRDLANQFNQPSLDAVRIGADYAEAESIRREIAAKQASYRTQWRATLTGAQQMQYQALLNGITLEPLLSEAGCAFLEDNATSSPFFSTSGSPFPTFISGDFSSSSFGRSGVLLPSIPPPPGASFCGLRYFRWHCGNI